MSIGQLTRTVKALRADLKAVAVAAKPFRGCNAPPPPGIVGVAKYQEGCTAALRQALDRPGVRKMSDQATSRAAATDDDCSGKS